MINELIAFTAGMIVAVVLIVGLYSMGKDNDGPPDNGAGT